VVFGIGVAGTGKTYLAVRSQCSTDAEASESHRAGPARSRSSEKLGSCRRFTEKVDPYLRPLYDALFD